MTYNYNEFVNQFAGADKLACGGKTKKVKSSCGGNKIKIAQTGTKTKKMSEAEKKRSIEDDANDLYISNLPEKPWIPDEEKQTTSKSTLLTPVKNNKNNEEGYVAPSVTQISYWRTAPVGPAWIDPKTRIPIVPRKK